MSRRSKTRKWLKDHVKDAYVQKAQKDGYRSRAAYKLLEIDERHRLFKKGLAVIDLGAAPGGWSQIAANRVGQDGQVIAIDLLKMKPIPQVEVMQGDMTDPVAVKIIEETLKKPCGLVISDMAPNITGIRDLDQAQAVRLWGLALEFACVHLRPKGNFLIKVFQGDGFEAFLKEVKESFEQVTVHKPKASRNQSREVYIVAKNANQD